MRTWWKLWILLSVSLPPHGLTRLLWPWDSTGKNTGVDCHALLQGIIPTQGSNPGLLNCTQILYHLSHWEAPLLKHTNNLADNFRANRNTFPHKAQFQSVLIFPVFHRNLGNESTTNVELTASDAMKQGWWRMISGNHDSWDQQHQCYCSTNVTGRIQSHSEQDQQNKPVSSALWCNQWLLSWMSSSAH